MEETGAITGYIDVAQMVLYAFWIFFAGLIYYLLRENKREGYPMDSADRGGRVVVVGFPAPPPPKTYTLANGDSVTVPREEAAPPISAKPVAPWPGAPYDPVGEPMLSRLGPGAYPEREHHPDVTIDGLPKIVPLRVAEGFTLAEGDVDPRGMPVHGSDGLVAGVLSDIWVDRSDPLVRYFEVTLPESEGSRRVVIPMNFVHVHTATQTVKVKVVKAAQFALAPALANDEQITFAEEDAVSSFFAGGLLFSDPDKAEPAV